MGILDRFTNGFLRTFDLLLGPFDEILTAVANRDPDEAEGTEQVARIIADASQIDEGAAALVDAFEEFVLTDLQEAGELTPENVEAVTDATEGNAIGLLASIIGGSMALEVGSAGQVDESQQRIVEALVGLGVDDVTGFELAWRMEKGVGPAMEAKVAKEHRSEFVSLQDAVEYLSRNKTGDEGYLRGENVDPDAASVIGSNVPVNPDNLVEEWGIRDDNLEVLEEVGIKVLEAEELLETPVEFGIIPDREVVERELDRNSLSEDTKQLFLDVVDSIPRATTAWEERTRYEELINLLDEAADSGELDPESVRPLFDDLDDRVVEELVERFRLQSEVPNKAPTRSQVDGSFAWGLTDLDTLEARYDQVDVDPDKYADIIDAGILDEIDGDLQQAYALGFLTDGEYGQLMDRVGLPTDAQTTLTAGGDLGDYTERVLSEAAEPEDQPVETVSGIGDARGAGLRAVGIETVADLATADVEVVVEAAQVAEETAQGYIDQAALRTN